EPTTTILGASPEPASFGEPVEVTATVIRDDGHGPVAGSVDFAVDGTPVGACQGVVLDAHGAAAEASCELTGLSGGAHTITATYSGETLIMPSSATLTAHVEPAVTTTNITSSANPSASGQPVTFTATVTQPLLGA